jgi:hypothetical protein
MYPTAQNPRSICDWNSNMDEFPEETLIVNKVRAMQAAAAAAASGTTGAARPSIFGNGGS